ncbi:MAG: hypothetical protein FJX76_12620 [Armatimonadetes bacterium]|nr:hypothetical protein [Armatimonadota bacterium]
MEIRARSVAASNQPTATCHHRRPRVVAIGDSLTAGTQDSTTVENRQAQSYMPQLARAVGLPFRMAYVSEGGIGPRLFVNGEFNYGHVQRRGQAISEATAPLEQQLANGDIPTDLTAVWNIPNMGSRTEESRDLFAHRQGNFAVPGYEIRHLTEVSHYNDYLRAMRDGEEASGLAGEVPLVRALLQNGTDESRGSAMDQAVRRNPDLAVVWAGNNDALETVGHGRVDDRLLTPVEDRPWTYLARNPETGQWEQKTTAHTVSGFRTSLLGDNGVLPRLLAETRAEIMLMTIPDVTTIPVLRNVGEKVGDLPFRVTLPDGRDVTAMIENWVLPASIRGAGKDGRTEFPAGSKVAMGNLLSRFVQQGNIESPEHLKQMLNDFSSQGMFTEDDVLDTDELSTISSRIREYNALILCARDLDPRIHVLDVHAEFSRMQTEGRQLRGPGAPLSVSTTFTGALDEQGREGIFSYDGVHPSDTGHAIVANMILDKVKEELGDNPKFGCFVDAAAIDEKAVLASDPHHLGNAIVLGKSA